jgi:hypothetical protein
MAAKRLGLKNDKNALSFARQRGHDCRANPT